MILPARIISALHIHKISVQLARTSRIGSMDARSGTAFLQGAALRSAARPRRHRCALSARYLSTEDLSIDFSVPARAGNFGNVFFGRYESVGLDVVVKCPTESDLGRKLFDMERHTNEKLAAVSPGALARFPRYLGELILPRDAVVAPGLARIGLAWQREGAGDTMEDMLNGGRIGTLAAILRTDAVATPLRRALTAAVLAELLTMLGTLQSAGIVHRDVKPENVLVVPGDPAPLKAIDFGSSCDWGSLLKHGLGLATCDPVYTAPERRLALMRPALKFDVYSVGLIALRCALPSLTDARAMAKFVSEVLTTNRSCLLRVCAAVERGNVQVNPSLRIELKSLAAPQNEDMLALLVTMLVQSPEDRIDVSSALKSRFLSNTSVLR